MQQNEMKESSSPLVAVDYAPHLRLIREVLQEASSLFLVQPNALIIQISEVATSVVARATEKKSSPRNPLAAPFAFTLGTLAATTNLEDEKALATFARLIEELRALLLRHCSESVTASTLVQTSLAEYVLSLSQRMEECTLAKPRGLHYPFTTLQPLQKRKMHLRSQQTRPSDSTAIRYRGHKVTITLENALSFDQEMIEGLCTVVQERGATDEEVTEVRDVLQRRKEDPTSELAVLKQLVKEESLGRIKLEACQRFFSYLVAEIEAYQRTFSSVTTEEQAGLRELQRLLRMLFRFQSFMDDSTRNDLAYQVVYAGTTFNLRSLFARADAFDILPIFAEVAGTLGETQDKSKDEQTFSYGLRLKLNGSVGTIPSTFQYYAMLINPKSVDHQERLQSPLWKPRFFAAEVMRIVVLYLALFELPDTEAFAERLQSIIAFLNQPDGEVKERRLQALSQRLLKSEQGKNPFVTQLEHSRLALEAYLDKASIRPTPFSLYCYLTIRSGILHVDDDRMVLQKRFFDPEIFGNGNKERSKDALKYFFVQEAMPEEDALYALPVRISFDPLYLSEVEESSVEQATMAYEVKNWQMFPVILQPATPECQRVSKLMYHKYGRVIIPFQETLSSSVDSFETGLYRFTFGLLTYLCLDMLREQIFDTLRGQDRRLFLPLIRIHGQTPVTGREQSRLPNEERVIRGLAKALAHMLSQEPATLSNTQGFSLETLQSTQNPNYYLENGLSSLYNILPRRIVRPPFAPKALDRLAVIVISSRRCDAHAASSLSIWCVYGEVLGFRVHSGGQLTIERIKTFSINENSDDLYTTPRTLLDEVRHCYQEGFRHILYVAKAPYTSTVHFTAKEEGEELFFMSPSIIKGVIDAFPDLMLYPIYNDLYYVNKVNPQAEAESLFIDDTRELRLLNADPNKSSVVFWNVLNGILVQPRGREKGHRYYNGVVSYATLINMYDNPLYDQAIRNNLLDGNQPGSLRADMLDFLSYLHSVRYERREKKGVQFKLDPYEEIIGYDSVGARSLFPSMDARVRFHTLAFLTLVRGVLRRHPRRPSKSETSVSSPVESALETGQKEEEQP